MSEAAHRKALIALSLAYGLVWGWALTLTSFWADEQYTAKILEYSWGGMVSALNKEIHPPLYFVCLRLWRGLFAWAGIEVALRSFSLACGMLGLWVWSAVFSRVLPSRMAGLGGAFLLAFAPFLGWYATEARGYQFLILMAGLAWLAWLRLMQQPAKRWNLVAAGAATAALPLTHITGMVGVSAFVAWLGLGWWRNELDEPRAKSAGLALALTWLIFWPQWREAKNQVEQTREFWTSRPGWNIGSELANYVETYFNAGHAQSGWLWALWIFVALAGLAWGLLKAPWPFRQILCAAFLGFFVAYWAGSQVAPVPFIIPRVTLPWVPLFFLAVSGALEAWGGGRLLLLGLAIFLAACLPVPVAQHLGASREDGRGAAAFVKAHAKKADVVTRSSYLDDYYLGKAGFAFTDTGPGKQRYWLLRRRSDARRWPEDWKWPEAFPKDFKVLVKRSFESSVDAFWTLDVLLVQPLAPGKRAK